MLLIILLVLLLGTGTVVGWKVYDQRSAKSRKTSEQSKAGSDSGQIQLEGGIAFGRNASNPQGAGGSDALTPSPGAGDSSSPDSDDDFSESDEPGSPPSSADFAALIPGVSVSPWWAVSACSQLYSFTGQIGANGAGSITWRWERWKSDQADIEYGATQTATFTGVGLREVYKSWSVSTTGDLTGWYRIRVLSPNPMLSNEGSFHLICS